MAKNYEPLYGQKFDETVLLKFALIDVDASVNLGCKNVLNSGQNDLLLCKNIIAFSIDIATVATSEIAYENVLAPPKRSRCK